MSMSDSSSTSVIVCIRWSHADPDRRFGGMSAADRAALEMGLRTAEIAGHDLIVVTAGPIESETILREALACGATRAVRVDLPLDIPSAETARAVASSLATRGPLGVIWCGDYSEDRGSGSFPAFLAAELGLDQALGLVEVDLPGSGSWPIDVVRRLDGGRRERIRILSSAVLSVEGSVARLRRAPLSASLEVDPLRLEVVRTGITQPDMVGVRPYRPRARILNSPAGQSPLERIRSVTATGSTRGHSEPIELEPDVAATTILDQLRSWGYST